MDEEVDPRNLAVRILGTSDGHENVALDNLRVLRWLGQRYHRRDILDPGHRGICVGLQAIMIGDDNTYTVGALLHPPFEVEWQSIQFLNQFIVHHESDGSDHSVELDNVGFDRGDPSHSQ